MFRSSYGVFFGSLFVFFKWLLNLMIINWSLCFCYQTFLNLCQFDGGHCITLFQLNFPHYSEVEYCSLVFQVSLFL